MTPAPVSGTLVTHRAAWIRDMIAGVRALPLEPPESFLADPRTAAAAESYLRRALEALLDQEQAHTLTMLAGHRNRMVHFYHAVSDEELREICTSELSDIEHVLDALLDWLRRDPARIDGSI